MSAPDPIVRFRRWFQAAARTGIPLPEAMALATATPRGRPSARFVLLKGVDERGFVFFTDGRSRKGDELAANPSAALVFYWHANGRQVRIEGRVERVSAAEADAYWRTRPRASRLAAIASRQSATLTSRPLLRARWLAARHRYGRADLPRPPEWSGFRVVPEAIEFWTRRSHRLHHRELFTRTRRGWAHRLLQP